MRYRLTMGRWKLPGRTLIAVLVVFLGVSTWTQGRFDDYVSAGSARLLSGTLERIQQREQEIHTTVVLALGSFPVTAAFSYFFTKFDRKQNTRLWPFVTAGTTRSPPLIF
jgi:hypothetical protein